LIYCFGHGGGQDQRMFLTHAFAPSRIPPAIDHGDRGAQMWMQA
jgi:hypothetical protein